MFGTGSDSSLAFSVWPDVWLEEPVLPPELSQGDSFIGVAGKRGSAASGTGEEAKTFVRVWVVESTFASALFSSVSEPNASGLVPWVIAFVVEAASGFLPEMINGGTVGAAGCAFATGPGG